MDTRDAFEHYLPYSDQLTEAWRVLELVNSWIQHAEQKLAAILAFMGVLSAGLFALVVVLTDPSPWVVRFLIVSAAATVMSVGVSVHGLLLEKGRSSQPSPYDYEDIDRFEDFKAFKAAFALTLEHPGKIFNAISKQVQWNSMIARSKLFWGNVALRTGAIAFFFAMAAMAALLLGW